MWSDIPAENRMGSIVKKERHISYLTTINDFHKFLRPFYGQNYGQISLGFSLLIDFLAFQRFAYSTKKPCDYLCFHITPIEDGNICWN